jgi:hypothetical protein
MQIKHALRDSKECNFEKRVTYLKQNADIGSKSSST